MKNYIYITTGILTLALIAGGVCVYSENQKVARQKDEAQQALAMQKLTKETDALVINVTYPIIVGAGTSQVNADIRADIDKKVESFEKDANESASLGIGLPQTIKSTVTGSPATEEKNNRYVALFLGMEWYLRGAAHPSHSIDTYVYDYEQRRLVAPPDYFKSGSAYLERLSALSKEDLLKQSTQGDLGFSYDENMVNEGTAPTQKNFSHILPLRDGLMIYFDEYQVAPYAAGPQQVVIPYAKLQDLIDPSGVLGMYIK